MINISSYVGPKHYTGIIIAICINLVELVTFSHNIHDYMIVPTHRDLYSWGNAKSCLQRNQRIKWYWLRWHGIAMVLNYPHIARSYQC